MLREKQILCASRNPTSPSRTSSCTKVAQDGAKLAPNWLQKSNKNGVPHRTWGPKMGYPIGPWGQKFKKNRLKKAIQQKKGRPLTAPPLLSRKSGQHGSKLASKIEGTPVGPLEPPREPTWAGRGHGDGLPPPAVSLRGFAWAIAPLAVTNAVEVVMAPVDLWSCSLG